MSSLFIAFHDSNSFCGSKFLIDSINDSNASKSDVPIGGDGKFTVPEKIVSDETIYEEGAYKYALYDDGTAIIVEHTGDETEIIIPDMLGGYPVSALASGAFSAASGSDSC